MYRLWPHKLRGEGHFAAVLRRKGEKSDAQKSGQGEKLPKHWLEFAENMQIELPEGKAITFGQNLYWASAEMPPIQGLTVLRPGLELGVVKKDRFEPAHALALWLKDCRNVVDYPPMNDEIRRYLEGNVIPSAKKGWCLVCAGGFSLGWGKGDGAVLKNHYPKGLRRLG